MRQKYKGMPLLQNSFNANKLNIKLHPLTEYIHLSSFAAFDASGNLTNSVSMTAISSHQLPQGFAIRSPTLARASGGWDGLPHACCDDANKGA